MNSLRVTIQLKATDQYFLVQILSLWVKFWSVTIQLKAAEQHFPVVMLIMMYKVVLSFEPVDEILECDHSNEIY